MADAIIAAHGLQVGRYQLAYTIMAWVEEQDERDGYEPLQVTPFG